MQTITFCSSACVKAFLTLNSNLEGRSVMADNNFLKVDFDQLGWKDHLIKEFKNDCYFFNKGFEYGYCDRMYQQAPTR